ncbi:mucin-5AC [Forsythia ovata]|uniref:Mucin-5AC n=1 Tax=Forsythia ovata TaxID=205694 RepID=A0ABD1VGT8_9LAMI
MSKEFQLISNVSPGSSGWTVKVVVAEKFSPRIAQKSPTKYQNLILMDTELCIPTDEKDFTEIKNIQGPKTVLANPQPEPSARSNMSSRQPASSPGLNASSGGLSRPSSSGGHGSRPATPTGRPTLGSTPRSTLTSASNKHSLNQSKPSTLTTSRIISNTASKPSRSATPTSRGTLSLSKPTKPRQPTVVTETTRQPYLVAEKPRQPVADLARQPPLVAEQARQPPLVAGQPRHQPFRPRPTRVAIYYPSISNEEKKIKGEDNSDNEKIKKREGRRR